VALQLLKLLPKLLFRQLEMDLLVLLLMHLQKLLPKVVMHLRRLLLRQPLLEVALTLPLQLPQMLLLEVYVV